MLYEEFPEWKQLKKEKKYKEAVEKLMYEIAVNLIKVSNLYCERKHDPYEEYYVACGPCYGENMNRQKEKKIYDFMDIAIDLSVNDLYLKDLDDEDDIPYHCKYLIKKLLKDKKMLIRKMKKIKET